MKRLLSIIICILVITAVALSLYSCSNDAGKGAVTVTTVSQPDSDADTLTVALADDFAPYLYEKGDGVTGMDVEVAEAFADDMGVSFEYVIADRDGIAQGLKDGKYDLALCCFTTGDMDEISVLTGSGVLLSDSCYGFVQAVFVDRTGNVGQFTEETAKDTDYTVAVKKDTAAEWLMHRDLPDDRILVVDNDIDALIKIIWHEADCVVTDLNPAYEYENKVGDAVLTSQPYSIGSFYFLSRDSKLIDTLNASKARLSEKISEIEKTYITDDTGFFASIKIWANEFGANFKKCFIDKDRWRFIVEGLGNTMLLTLMAAALGVIIGIIIAAIRTTYDNNRESMKYNKSPAYYILGFFNAICKVYLTVIRGTPVFIQLLIIYFGIFASPGSNKMLVATLAFGINSGAYVAEILRGGIMSIDRGQFEAGRSIGFNYIRTMRYIVIPQVLKNVLPTLLNEFITLLKETSVAFYIGVLDLTRAGNKIRGDAFTDMLPLLAVALIYLIVVMILTWIVGIIERRLRKSER